jgi:hypothetical protein
VRTNDFVMRLQAGYTFVAPGFPGVDSPFDLFGCAIGFSSGLTPDDADQILTFNGGGYDVFFLFGSGAGSTTTWRRADANAMTEQAVSAPVGGGSFFVRKLVNEPSFIMPCAIGL